MVRRVLIAVGFNLLFEYSLRGINDLAHHPMLPVFLLLLYFPYFMLVDEFVRTRRAGADAVAAVGFGFGSLSALFLPGSMFDPRGTLGLNWKAFLFVNVVWWATLQGVLTMYAAVRCVPRLADERGFGARRRMGLALWLLLGLVLFRAGIRTPSEVRPIAASTVLVFGVAALGCAWWLSDRRVSRKHAWEARPSRLMDALLVATTVLFVLCMLLLTHDPVRLSIHRVNLTALRVVIGWTTLLFLVTLVRGLATRRSLPV